MPRYLLPPSVHRANRMTSASSQWRRRALLIAIASPALLGSEWKCTAVSNPTVATARIELVEPTAPQVGEIVQVTGSGNGTEPLQFAWDFGDGTAAAGSQAAHVYLAAGTFDVRLTVRDANGNVDRDEHRLVVSARVSQVRIVVPVSKAVAGQPVEFVSLPFDETADEHSYVWTFSNGQSALGPRAAAVFPMPGVYQASVEVTNAQGETSDARTEIRVADRATP